MHRGCGCSVAEDGWQSRKPRGDDKDAGDEVQMLLVFATGGNGLR